MKSRITDDDVLVTTQLLAKIYGVTTRTIQNWTKAGCPKYAPGGYSLHDVAAWMKQGTPDEEKDVSEMSLAKQKIYYESRHRAALAEIQRMKLQSMKREMIPAEQITEDLRRFAAVLKKEIYGIGRDVIEEASAELEPERVRKLDERITRRIDAALRQLSAGEFRCGDDGDD